MTEETEQQLLDAIHHGDRTAMRRLYDRYVGRAMAIGLRYIPERDEVEDVVQDSFVRILTSIQQFRFRGEGSLSAWVSRIVANRAIDYLKQRERLTFTGAVPDIPDNEEPDAEEIPPDVLTKMIGQLPTGYRLVLNLYVFEHCSHKEIAQRLGIKENSSASQLNRARKMLAKMMKDYLTRQER